MILSVSQQIDILLLNQRPSVIFLELTRINLSNLSGHLNAGEL